MELTDELYDQIVDLCEEGDELVEEEHYKKAKNKYLEALHLVPTPKTEWESSTWIYAALGDTCFFMEDFQSGKEYLFDALNCPEGASNPFILLRLGQCLLELKDAQQAKEYLLRAYMIEGYTIFHSEDDKYFDVIKEMI